MLTRQVEPPQLRPVWNLVITVLMALSIPPAAALFALALLGATVQFETVAAQEPPVLTMKVTEDVELYNPPALAIAEEIYKTNRP